jgi:RNA polymerase sigma-70 factor, ECF subfamily
MPVPPRRHVPAGIVQYLRPAADPEDREVGHGADVTEDPGTILRGGQIAEERDAVAVDSSAALDRALVEETVRGSLDAFNRLVLRHQDFLFGLVYRLVPDRDQAADVVQEAFLSAYKNVASFRGGSVKSWLGRIAINGAMDLQRSRRRRPTQPYPELEDESWQPPDKSEAEPEARSIALERSRVLATALDQLNPDQKACIVLFDVQGYDYAEIAEMMQVEVGTVKSRIHRGRLALRNALQSSGELFRG